MCFLVPQGVSLLGEVGDPGGGNHSAEGGEPQRAGAGGGWGPWSRGSCYPDQMELQVSEKGLGATTDEGQLGME